ncbi:SDR family NAD(P)-dependent oxidoreductase [Lysobacter pythonis]|uniref:SDR family NAD(P)-dependent oxidoreductase n=1 Tax=Solilutibacter pythonis TaxID=2483112 RepID=A0A3M2HV24_9GAMM|nr:type I polyketide synthase [Lysobacter pythonis]RMH93586.1 SDR family NAD(P)-dependent oxidoreductase [Lysobacter pythonis]
MHHPDAIAVIGFAARLPGADSAEQFWRNSLAGHCALQPVENAPADVPAEYVRHCFAMSGAADFDAEHFGISPSDARLMDPQQRVFLETVWHALEHAGYCRRDPALNIGLFASAGFNDYVMKHVGARHYHQGGAEYFRMLIASDKDFIATRTAYHLDLRGPAVGVQSACSSSLLGVHLAIQSLLQAESDLAIAGASAVCLDLDQGYAAEAGGPMSPSGRIAPFDERADGIIGGNGVAAVVLKRLDDALRDDDTIHGVIHASAANNDGFDKAGLTAPSARGQSAVLAEALALSGLDANDIRYIETHGTGTPLGDPIEFQALEAVYGQGESPCYLGSAKANIGHLNTVSGVVGLIKAVLSVRDGRIAPLCHFHSPNPQLAPSSRLRFNREALPWPGDPANAFAAVSSFGVGGTNVHLIVGAPPVRTATIDNGSPRMLCWSARTPAQAEQLGQSIADALRQDIRLADAETSLLRGRRALSARRALLAHDSAEAASRIEQGDIMRDDGPRPIALLFPGQGSQFAGMGRTLYREDARFRQQLDHGAEYLTPLLGYDVRPLIFGDDDAPLRETLHTQLSLFLTSHALARSLIGRGLRPDILLGHSIGEYVAAVIAGVMSFEDGLRLVHQRAHLVSKLPGAAMLSVCASAERLDTLLPAELSLAVINRAERCVVSGTAEDIEGFAETLAGQGIDSLRLNVSHGFHSHLLEPMLDEFRLCCEQIHFNAPALPMLSNLHGGLHASDTPITADYWVRHLRETVRFHDNLDTLARQFPNVLAVETGPGQVLSDLARRTWRDMDADTIPTLSSPLRQAQDMQACLARLWVTGTDMALADTLGDKRPGRRVPLPLYPFQRQTHLLPELTRNAANAAGVLPAGQWVQAPQWRGWPVPAGVTAAPAHWLYFLPDHLTAPDNAHATVTPGDAWRMEGARITLDPDDDADWQRLCEQTRDVTDIVFAWPLADARQPPADTASPRHFNALLRLAKTLARHDWRGRLLLITPPLQPLLGDESVSPWAALAVGLVRNWALEYPGIQACTLETPDPLPTGILAALFAETRDNAADVPHFAARHGRLWRQYWTPVPLPPAHDERQGQVVVLIGGTGGLGQVLARSLAGKVRTLVIVSRHASALATQESHRELQATLRAAGTEPIYIGGDIAEADFCARLCTRLASQFGTIDRIYHLAGRYINQTLEDLAPNAPDSNLRSKAQGAWTLLSHLSSLSCGKLVLFSSTTAELSGIGCADYGAANLFLNSLAHQPSNTPIQTIAWDAWAPSGALGESLSETDGLFHDAQHGAFSVEEALALLQRIEDSALPCVLVSKMGLAQRRQALADTAARYRQAGGSQADAAPARIESIDADDDLERCMCCIFAEQLGLERVSTDDDFLRLGGDSLLAVRTLSQLRGLYETSMSLADFIQHRTPRALAALLSSTPQARRIAGLYLHLRRLSDDERHRLAQRLDQRDNAHQENASA